MKNYKISNLDKKHKEDAIREQYLPRETIFEAIGDLTGKKVIDIGYNTGYYTEALSKKIGNTGKLYSTDVNTTLVEMITYQTKDAKNIINTVSNESNLPLQDSIIDIALSINSFHEFDDKEVILEEIFRILKSKGRLFIIDFSPEASRPPGPPKDLRVFKDDVILVAEDLGFKYLKSFETGIYHYGLMFEKN